MEWDLERCCLSSLMRYEWNPVGGAHFRSRADSGLSVPEGSSVGPCRRGGGFGW